MLCVNWFVCVYYCRSYSYKPSKQTEVNIRRRRLRLQRPPLLLPLSPPLPRVETGNAQPAVRVPVSASSRQVQDSAQARVLCNRLSNTTGSGRCSSSGSVQSFNQKHDRFGTRLKPGFCATIHQTRGSGLGSSSGSVQSFKNNHVRSNDDVIAYLFHSNNVRGPQLYQKRNA